MLFGINQVFEVAPRQIDSACHLSCICPAAGSVNRRPAPEIKTIKRWTLEPRNSRITHRVVSRNGGATRQRLSDSFCSKVVQFNLFISTQDVWGQLGDEGVTGQSVCPDRSSGNSNAKVEVFIYMRLSLLHSASATIAPAGSSWTNDSQRALKHGGGGCCFRTEGLKRHTTRARAAFRFLHVLSLR